MSELESWESASYAVEWASDDVLAELLELPRRISVALVADADLDVRHVVDLGSGHGPYLERFMRAFPSATGTWVDTSDALRELAGDRLAEFGDRVRYVLADVERLEDAELEPADVVVTSRVLHHFSPASLQHVYAAVHELLNPGGFLFNLDHVGPPGDWDARYRRIRSQFVAKRRKSLKPHRHDYPMAPPEQHLDFIAAAGFETPDIAWRTFYTVLLAARRKDRRAGSASAT